MKRAHATKAAKAAHAVTEPTEAQQAVFNAALEQELAASDPDDDPDDDPDAALDSRN